MESSMGFSNHSFYESLEEFRNHKTKENPYYAYMRDEKKNWLDSHKVGIDGPLIHWDDEDSSNCISGFFLLRDTPWWDTTS